MSFGSFGEFLAMGGHALYVWLSYGAALIIVAYNVVSVRRAQRRFFRDARDRERRRGSMAGTGDGVADAVTGAVATGETTPS